MNQFTEAIQSFDAAALRDLVIAAAARAAALEQPAVIARETSAVLDDRARFHLAIPQWLTAEGAARGVVIQALSFEDRWQAERAATRYDERRRESVTDEWRRMLEEVTRAIVEPRIPVEVLKRWNYEIVEYVHSAALQLAPAPPAILSQELARLAGGPAPQQPASANSAAPVGDPDDVDSDPSAAAEPLDSGTASAL